MATNSDMQIINMLQDLVREKEDTAYKMGLLESILSRNNIYFIAFNPSEEVLYHNVPDKISLEKLEDCGYILGSGNIERIRTLIDPSGTTGAEAFKITMKNNILEFTLFTQKEFQELFFLQISMFNQGRSIHQGSEEKELQATETGLEDIQNALALLDEIRNLDSKAQRDEFNQEIQHNYIRGLDKLKATIQDPIVTLCLDIIHKNLMEFISPAGTLSELYKVLTPSEIQVAEFIRMGKTSKDIADALDIAQKTVENHRNKVRNKLGLRNRGINLRSYLMQLDNSS